MFDSHLSGGVQAAFRAFAAFVFLFISFCGQKKEETLPETATARVDKISLRTEPITTASVIEFLDVGSKLHVLKKGERQVQVGQMRDYWYFVETENGIQGWVFGANLSLGSGPLEEEALPDPKVVQERITGKWWELRPDGTTGFRKIYFWADGKFKYFYGVQTLKEGRYEIIVRGKTIRLDALTGIGDHVTFDQVGDDYRLFAEKDGQKFVFRRGGNDPESSEVGSEEKDKEKASQNAPAKP